MNWRIGPVGSGFRSRASFPWPTGTEYDQISSEFRYGESSLRWKRKIAAILAVAIVLTAAYWMVTVGPRLRLQRFLATAYATGQTTKSGVPVREGIVAADPKVLPLGSVIRIMDAGEYSGKYKVMDTGAKIKGKRIDIYMRDYDEAKEFGAQIVKVRIISIPEGEDSGSS
jgi:3D (Asp-Asp-Asp) domain-containing protein